MDLGGVGGVDAVDTLDDLAALVDDDSGDFGDLEALLGSGVLGDVDAEVDDLVGVFAGGPSFVSAVCQSGYGVKQLTPQPWG